MGTGIALYASSLLLSFAFEKLQLKKLKAKVNSSNKKEVNTLPGKAVMYMGSKNAEPYTCPTCSRSLIKGIIYEHEGSSYCKRGCFPKVEKVDAA